MPRTTSPDPLIDAAMNLAAQLDHEERILSYEHSTLIAGLKQGEECRIQLAQTADELTDARAELRDRSQAVVRLCDQRAELTRERDAARAVRGYREAELLTIKGPCSRGDCTLHYAHSGPCDIRTEVHS